MTSQSVLITLLKNYYASAEAVSETVIQCQRNHEGGAYQVVFFDHSDNFLSYDLQSYLKQYISIPYFRNAGILQWNFYLIFLTEQTISEADRLRIEGNADFTRKLIIPETELISWLNRFYLVNRKLVNPAQTGLAEIWKGILKTEKLDCIFSAQVKVNDGVDRIISGNNFVAQEAANSKREFQDKDVNIGELRLFNPIKFREYPKFSEPFSFKKVNLIDGANGHGKTSLLEAIEFFITGSNDRVNPGENNFEIEAQFTADQTLRKYKKDTALFRERDRVWYNGMDKQRGSDLAAHFNQFNFYNTDAAFRLTINKNEQEIEDAFREIALGDEVNFLKRQFLAYESKFQTELKSRQKLIEEYGGDIKEQRLLLTELRKSDGNETALIQTLFDKVKACNLNLDTTNQDLVALDRLKFSLSVLLSELDAVIKNINWVDNLSVAEIRTENKKLEELVSLIDQYNTSLDGYLKDVNDLNKSHATHQLRIEFLTEFSNYVQDNIYNQLAGLSGRLAFVRTKLEQLREVKVGYTDLALFIFEFPELPIGESRRQQLEKLREKEEAISRIDQQISIGQQTLSELTTVISSIKNQGKRYLSLTEGSTECPLCQTDFKVPASLKDAVLSTLKTTIERSDFTGLLDVKTTMEADKKNIENQIEMLSRLVRLSGVSILPNNTETVNTLHLKAQIEELLASMMEEELKFDELEHQALSFHEKGLREERLSLLELRFRELYPSEQITAGALTAELERIRVAQQKIKDRLKLSQDNAETAAVKIVGSIQAYEPTFSLSMEAELRQRLLFTGFHLKELTNLFAASFDEKKAIGQLQLELQGIVQQVDEIRSDIDLKQKESGLANKANEIIAVKTGLLDIAKLEYARLKTSLASLNLMLKEHSEDDFLRDFFDMNKEEIKEIFLSIHSPREFKDINITGGKVLLDKLNGDTVDLMRISTGQRSALALSLFLTLNNKLKNGPPMIIFDDPVAFTDDLNILSFLDYLREVVFSQNEKKQLFFATANENLSFLFQKKFEMLGEEFNHINLER